MLVKIFWDVDAAEGMGRPVAKEIADILQMDIELDESPVMLTGFNRHRKQFDAGQILERIQLYKKGHRIREPVLLVTGKDLFIKGSDFVYGLAKEAFGAAVVSTARMQDEFYQRRTDLHALCMRTATEGAHEIGHLFGLSHCPDISCVMFAPENRDQLDRKSIFLCRECRSKLESAISSSHPE
ncbi:MAG: archaemetzincin family Zn-dependent metalloprotease [Methanomicrobiales archaeon]|nr:archaemetzincin family Zn-dependent metalloprotease [Methanomicrobiales archaeon]